VIGDATSGWLVCGSWCAVMSRSVDLAASEGRRPGRIDAERDAACERAGFALADWHRAPGEIAEAEACMVAVLYELG
jgi:hypothetical protein